MSVSGQLRGQERIVQKVQNGWMQVKAATQECAPIFLPFLTVSTPTPARRACEGHRSQQELVRMLMLCAAAAHARGWRLKALSRTTYRIHGAFIFQLACCGLLLPNHNRIPVLPSA